MSKKSVKTQIAQTEVSQTEVSQGEIANVEVAQIKKQVEKLGDFEQVSFEQLVGKINEIIDTINNAPSGRNRGPVSEQTMTEEHARLVMLGEDKNLSHKDAAAKLKLSYGQIYSARKGFTFKNIYKEMIAANQA